MVLHQTNFSHVISFQIAKFKLQEKCYLVELQVVVKAFEIFLTCNDNNAGNYSTGFWTTSYQLNRRSKFTPGKLRLRVFIEMHRVIFYTTCLFLARNVSWFLTLDEVTTLENSSHNTQKKSRVKFRRKLDVSKFTSQISLPNVFRSIEYLVASSNARWAKPTAPPATWTQTHNAAILNIFSRKKLRMKNALTLCNFCWCTYRRSCFIKSSHCDFEASTFLSQ